LIYGDHTGLSDQQDTLVADPRFMAAKGPIVPCGNDVIDGPHPNGNALARHAVDSNARRCRLLHTSLVATTGLVVNRARLGRTRSRADGDKRKEPFQIKLMKASQEMPGNLGSVAEIHQVILEQPRYRDIESLAALRITNSITSRILSFQGGRGLRYSVTPVHRRRLGPQTGVTEYRRPLPPSLVPDRAGIRKVIESAILSIGCGMVSR
jgi:hypothetical protein